MSRFKIVNLFDRIFITSVIFLIVYAWISFFMQNLILIFLLSLIFTFSITFLLFYYIHKKNKKKVISQNYLNDMKNKFLAFKLCNKNEKTNLIKSILLKDMDIKSISEDLVYSKNNQTYQIIIATDFEKLSQNELLNLISFRTENVDILKIICEDFETNLNTQILNNLKIEIVTKKILYDEFFLTYNTFPDCSKLITNKQKFDAQKVLKNFFTPNKSKGYFLCGLILIFSSMILPFHKYYLIFGTSLLIASIICKLISLLKN